MGEQHLKSYFQGTTQRRVLPWRKIKNDWFFNTFDVYKSTDADFEYKTKFPNASNEVGALKYELNELLKEAP